MSAPKLRKVDLYILEGEPPPGPAPSPPPALPRKGGGEGPPPAGEEPPAAPLPAGPLAHSPDFAAVRFRGVVYTFNSTQRSVVAALFHARDEGYHWVSQEQLIDVADADARRLRDLFRNSPAWGVLILNAAAGGGGPPGAYRLAEAA